MRTFGHDPHKRRERADGVGEDRPVEVFIEAANRSLGIAILTIAVGDIAAECDYAA